MHQQANETESEVDVPEPRIAPDSSRVDEPLEAETTSILPAAPEEPQSEKTEPLPTDEGGPFPASVSLEAIESRSLLAISLRPSAFPGDRARLLQVARDEDAEERVIAQLETLPVTDLFMNASTSGKHSVETSSTETHRRQSNPTSMLPQSRTRQKRSLSVPKERYGLTTWPTGARKLPFRCSPASLASRSRAQA